MVYCVAFFFLVLDVIQSDDTLKPTSEKIKRRHARPLAFDSDDNDDNKDGEGNDDHTNQDEAVLSQKVVTSEPLHNDSQNLVSRVKMKLK